jgi:glutamate formiminotransferase/formiminotetrahydrofolate cyclodeaminase
MPFFTIHPKVDIGIANRIGIIAPMPTALVECVPNFSEARRPEVIAAIAQAMTAVPGVRLLDRHSDLDHNRTVLTLVGPPEAILEAAFQGIRLAAERIDLEQHRGEHPRLGATDVVPFVPLSGVTMEQCVELAQRLGRRVGEQLGLPVYLYEQAATRPERQNLENIRRGQYETLKTEIGVKPERAPDYGPARLGPAGAVVIGARPFLIAFNVYLTTAEVAVAEKIAKAIRHSSGGLRFVKALGLLVEGRAQVSMNLTDFHKTPLARVVELIRREAQRYGVGIHHSELVGLIPKAALVDAAVWYLQLDQFEPDQVLERKLYAGPVEATVPQAPVADSFLDELAAGKPTPGGGSAAAYAGAMAAALVAMVARLTIGKKKYMAVEEAMRAVLEGAETLRAELSADVKQDAAAYAGVLAALQLPKDSPVAELVRRQRLEQATLQAARVPLEVAERADRVLELALQVVATGNVNAISDGGVAAGLAHTAVTGAGLNVRANIASLPDPAAGQQLLARMEALENKAAGLHQEIQAQIARRAGLPST